MSDTVAQGLDLRAGADELASGFPSLLAAAEELASLSVLGPHGRKRPGQGAEFWQYRMAEATDGLRDIDWRRSARSEERFVRQMELQIAQSVSVWVDQGASMDFTSDPKRDTKARRAELLGLAAALLMARAGERVGLIGDGEPPKFGLPQIERMAMTLAHADRSQDYIAPKRSDLLPGSHAIFISDFLGDWDQIVKGLSNAAGQRVHGLIVQVLDPVEESFPFSRRILFESVRGGVTFETKQAGALRTRFLAKLTERQNALRELARNTGWQVLFHRTDKNAVDALRWIFFGLENAR